MKIKKFNEAFAYEMSEEELNSFREKKFPDDPIHSFELYGENLNFSKPEYNKLYSSNNLKECIEFYNENYNFLNKDIGKINSWYRKFDNFFIVEIVQTQKLTNLDIYLDVNKYNL
jgi:hypothetical protein